MANNPMRRTNRWTRGKSMDQFSPAGTQLWRMSVDARLGGGGCREENRPRVQTEYSACEPALHMGTPLLYRVVKVVVRKQM